MVLPRKGRIIGTVGLNRGWGMIQSDVELNRAKDGFMLERVETFCSFDDGEYPR